MKKGFALLETMIAIAFLAGALLLLYSTFSGLVLNAKKNYLYDDVANIYKTYYVKEYLEIKDLIPSSNEAIQEISCTEIESLCTNFKIKKIYLTNYVLKEEEKNTLASSLKDYLNNLSDAGDYLKRLVIEYDIDNNSFYANIGVE